MNCPTCQFGPVPCRHPEVAPHEGEPPEPTGAAVIEWCADNVRVHPRTGRVQIKHGVRCPGFTEKGESR